MNYKYPPIYKYGLLFLVIYMFMKHQKILTQDKLLLNAVMITLLIFVFDSVMIKNHTSLLENSIDNTKLSHKKSKHIDNISDDDLDEIINSYDVSIEEELQRDNVHNNDSNDNGNIQVNIRRNRMNGQNERQNERQYFSTDLMY